MRIFLAALVLVVSFGLIGAKFQGPAKSTMDVLLLGDALPRCFDIQVGCVGNLEAGRSNLIASAVKGDLGKLIYLIPEGSRVSTGEILVKMDPAPFEEAIGVLQEKIRSKKNAIETLAKSLEWEKHQVEHEIKAAGYEIEVADLELHKITYGDGPQELSNLQGCLQRELVKYEELQGYLHDLDTLEAEGLLNPSEIKQAERQLAEAKAAYENAQVNYDSYVHYMHPMQIKRAETALKRAINQKEECIKAGEFRIAKETSQMHLAQQELNDLKKCLKASKNDLIASEIKAPSPGMVVHREEFRSGQRRKPRIGDVLIKNQPILDLPDLDSMNVRTKVRELDLCKVQIGLPVSVKVDAFPNLLIAGYVKSIGVLAVNDIQMGDEKCFEVVVALDVHDAHLRPGMTARLMIHSAHIKDTLSIPVHAVFEHAKQPYCYVMQNGLFAVKPISIGQSNEDWVEVLSGIDTGQKVSLIQPSEEQICL